MQLFATKKFNQLVAKCLYNKAYSCSFAANLSSDTSTELTANDLNLRDNLKVHIGNNSCVLKCSNTSDDDKATTNSMIEMAK